MFRSSVALMSLAGRASRFSRAFGPVRAHREAGFLRWKGSMARHGIRAWRGWDDGKSEMIGKDSIVRRNRDGSYLHHSAPFSLDGFARDAAPVGSEVGGIGEESMGYRKNSRTTSTRRGKIETLGQGRSDAVANVLATWATGSEVEIVEDGETTYLCLWTPIQSAEGAPEDAIATNALGKTSIVDRVRG
jgi:hypothetical protein